MRHLSRFYAVTMSNSLYRADIGESSPSLLKIAKGKNVVEEGVMVNEKIEGSHLSILAIAKFLFLFIPEKYGMMHQMTGFEREPAMVNTYYWEGGTSLVVGLFLKKKDALNCLEAKDLQFCDPRWREKTIEAIKEIGSNHPYCSVSTCPTLCLIPVSEWKD